MASVSLGLYLLFLFYSDYMTTVCPSQRSNLDCTALTYPVCAYYKGPECNSISGYCQRDEESFCSACGDKSVMGYDYGDCSESSIHICTREELNSSCTDSGEPVCAFSVDSENGRVSYQTIDDGCSACTNKTIGFYTRGECHLDYVSSNGTDGHGDATMIETLKLGLGTGGSYSGEEESAEYVLTSSFNDLRTNKFSLSVTTYQSGAISTKLTRTIESNSSESTSVRYFD